MARLLIVGDSHITPVENLLANGYDVRDHTIFCLARSGLRSDARETFCSNTKTLSGSSSLPTSSSTWTCVTCYPRPCKTAPPQSLTCWKTSMKQQNVCGKSEDQGFSSVQSCHTPSAPRTSCKAVVWDKMSSGRWTTTYGLISGWRSHTVWCTLPIVSSAWVDDTGGHGRLARVPSLSTMIFLDRGTAFT